MCMTYTVDLNIKISRTVQERNVQTGCTLLTCSSNTKKINKNKDTKTQKVLCANDTVSMR